MRMRALGNSGLETAPIVFGGNVFGWTADEKTSFALLDAFVDAGFNAIDTADVYSAWAPGNSGGESETIIGRWLKANPAKRDKVLILTKVGSGFGRPKRDLSAGWIAQSVEGSLRRLQVDRIDLYQSHWPDPDTSQAETLGAYEVLLKAGKIGAIGASNLNAEQLKEALRVAREHGLPRYATLQPEYNLYDRDGFDATLRDFVLAEGIGVITYYSLASGFLSGKYRQEADLTRGARGKGIAKYLNPRGMRILDALDAVAAQHAAEPAQVALAWLIAQQPVTAPIVSATTLEQLQRLIEAVHLTLTVAELALLDEASG
jgi:aryl-alcohol dehydrogenase-like predicted oxidoreductase